MKEQHNHLEYLKQILLSMLDQEHFQLQRVYAKGNSINILNEYIEELIQLVDMPIKDIMKLYTKEDLQELSSQYFNIQQINNLKSVIIEADKQCSKFETAFQQCEFIITHLSEYYNTQRN